MRLVSAGFAGVALATVLTFAPVHEAKADGGLLIGVGVYFVGDYIVGRKCQMYYWPLNIPTKIAYALHGKRVCRYYRRHR